MGKKKALLPFFILKLFLINLVFFTSVLIIPLHRQKLLLFSGTFFVLYLIFLGKHILPRTPQEVEPVKLINVKSQQRQLMTFKDFSKLELFKNKLIGLNKLSPNNRDVLLNLSLISFYQNKVEEHQQLWNQALATDPNNPLFIKD